ncbi:MAG: hypothetical protein V1748_08105 [Actinomycetota bacterium]
MAYCPECGAEYREGFIRCDLCDTDLVDEPPQRIISPPDESSTRVGRLQTHRYIPPRGASGDEVALLAWVAFLSTALALMCSAGVSLEQWFASPKNGFTYYLALLISTLTPFVTLTGILLLITGLLVFMLDSRHRLLAKRFLWVVTITYLAAVMTYVVGAYYLLVFNNEGASINTGLDVARVIVWQCIYSSYLIIGAAVIYILSARTSGRPRSEASNDAG